ncbi:MAG: PAS domain-containing protein [Pilosibacter sp.]
MEISQYLDFDFLIRFLEGLQKFLGENSEILIHDYRKGYDHTIVYALNPAVSGRAVGGSPKGGMITQLGKDIEPMKDSIQTFSNGPKDRFYKSFTTLIPDENGKIVGSVCVNLDVSDLLNAQRALGAFVQYPMTHHAPTNDIDALATKNVDDILKYYMKQAELLVGKPMGLMNKEEKIRALDYLDQKGVFKISKTSVLLCETLQVSNIRSTTTLRKHGADAGITAAKNSSLLIKNRSTGILIYLYSGLHFSQLFSTCIAANKKPILLELFLCHLNNTFMFLSHSVIINSNQ